MHRRQVAQARLRQVLLHTRVGTVAATLFALLLAQHLLANPRSGLGVDAVHHWLVLKLAVAAARMALAQAYARLGTGGRHWQGWQRAVLGLLVLDGAVWGLAGWYLAAESVPLASLGAAALAGVSCVGTFGLQVRLAATAAYVLPMLLPTVLGLAWRGDEIAFFGGAGLSILLALTLLTARASSRQVTTSILLRLQAESLIQQKDDALRLAQEQSAERSRFLAKVSHELRTPLHAVLGLARLLKDERDPAQALHRLGLIEASGEHLLVLINDLLDVSRLKAGHFTLHDRVFDLAGLIDQVAEMFRLLAADKGLALDCQVLLPRPHWVQGDAARLRQVLANLLGNALKFTRHGRVGLIAERSATSGRVRLTVHDTGEGISPADQLRIFAPFQQAGTASPTDGVGLGLTIAREIAVAMGGDIRVQSQVGDGARFTFEARLPDAPAPAGTSVGPMPGTRRPDDPEQPLPQLVLVAEDDEVNTLIVTGFLQGLGVRFEHVPDGREAVARALRQTDRPDLVLMDCRMPVLDGLAAAQQIRQQERALGLPRLPILALTATAHEADVKACLAAGMDQVITKPFTRDALQLALRQARPAGPALAAALPERVGTAG